MISSPFFAYFAVYFDQGRKSDSNVIDFLQQTYSESPKGKRQNVAKQEIYMVPYIDEYDALAWERRPLNPFILITLFFFLLIVTWDYVEKNTYIFTHRNCNKPLPKALTIEAK